jgi:hypothetical protein
VVIWQCRSLYVCGRPFLRMRAEEVNGLRPRPSARVVAPLYVCKSAYSFEQLASDCADEEIYGDHINGFNLVSFSR